jgi:hypothetical protein
VADAISNSSWLDDIKKTIIIQTFHRILAICEEISSINLLAEDEDVWFWSWDPKGTYSSKSIYNAHFAASTSCASLKRENHI